MKKVEFQEKNHNYFMVILDLWYNRIEITQIATIIKKWKETRTYVTNLSKGGTRH